MHSTQEEGIKRGEFLRSLGLSSATLMAYYCLGTTMTSCGSKEDDPDPGTGGGSTNGIDGTTTGTVNYTVNLGVVTALKTGGNYQIIGDTIVALTSGGAYVALARRCTHEGTNVQYRNAQNDFFCANHGSEFSTTGAVEQGPATSPLKVYTTTLSTDGNTLTVKG